MIDILNTVFTGIGLLIVWFHTEAFIEYSKLLKISSLFKINEFEKAYDTDYTLEYLTWLKLKYPTFLTKLITCPWCIGFWVSIICALFFNTFYIFPVVYVITIIMYLTIVKIFFR